MNILESIFLGLLQGITEFLPVSSSGHLVLFQNFFNIKLNDIHIFDIILHFATLLAVCLFFKEDLIQIFNNLLAGIKKIVKKETTIKELYCNEFYIKLVFLICVTVIPTGIIGIVFKDFFEKIFSSENTLMIISNKKITGEFLVYCSLVFTGITLYLTKFKKDNKISILNFPLYKALIIGIVQGIAIIPGISRSGSTIAAALFLGIHREISARFSFLISIPVIFGATLLEIRKISSVEIPLEIIFCGFFAAFVSGYFSLRFLLKIIKNSKIHYFAYYCIPAGLFGAFYFIFF